MTPSPSSLTPSFSPSFPPLFGLICDCGSSLPLFRQFLQGYTQADYMSVPVYRGQEAKTVVASLDDSVLSAYLSNRGTFVIVASYSPNSSTPLKWVDINNAKLPQQLEAKSIVEEALDSAPKI